MERKVVDFKIEEINYAAVWVEGTTYTTEYIRGEGDKKHMFLQIIKDINDDLCPYCGENMDKKDHSKCEKEYVTENNLLETINELQEDSRTSPDGGHFIFNINHNLYRVV